MMVQDMKKYSENLKKDLEQIKRGEMPNLLPAFTKLSRLPIVYTKPGKVCCSDCASFEGGRWKSFALFNTHAECTRCGAKVGAK